MRLEEICCLSDSSWKPLANAGVKNSRKSKIIIIQDQVIVNRNKTGLIVDFDVPTAKRVKIIESEKINKYLHLAWKLQTLWNIKVTVIPIVTGALGTMLKGLVKGLEDLEIRQRAETIQTCKGRLEYWEECERLTWEEFVSPLKDHLL